MLSDISTSIFLAKDTGQSHLPNKIKVCSNQQEMSTDLWHN